MVSDQLALVAQSEVDQRSKTDQYHAVLKEITAKGDVDSCKAFVDHCEAARWGMRGAFTSAPQRSAI